MRRMLLILAVVAAGLLLIALALPLLINIDRFRPSIQTELSKSLGRDVKIGALDLNLMSGTVTATDLSIADDPSFSKTDFLRTKALKLSFHIRDFLFSRRLNIDGLTID